MLVRSLIFRRNDRFAPRRDRSISSRLRIALAAAILAAGSSVALAQSSGVDAGPSPWTDAPVHVDRNAQTFQRIEASPVSAPSQEDGSLRFGDGAHFKILDSVSFAEGGRTYRLAGLEPVPSKRICRNGDGARWACGLRARAALDGLLIGPMMRCSEKAVVADVTLVACDRAGQDIGGLLVTGGHAVVAKGAGVYDHEFAEASAAKAGIWGDVAQTP